MDKYPKLKYPIKTKGLDLKDRALLLAYDIVYKAKLRYDNGEGPRDDDFSNDLHANLQNLGYLIEHNLCSNGDLSQYFDLDLIEQK